MRTITPRLLPWVACGLLAVTSLGPARADVPTDAPAPPAPLTPPAEAPFVQPDLGAFEAAALIVPGNVPLHGRDQTALCGLFERAFALALAAPQRRQLADGLARLMRDAGPLERQSWLALLDAHEQIEADLENGRHAEAQAALEGFRVGLDRALADRRDSDLHRAVAQVLGRSRSVVWPGEPAIDGLRADAYMEAVVFVAALGRNERIVLTEGQAAVLDEHLRAQLAGRDAADREVVRAIAPLWAQVRRTWTTLTPAARLRARCAAASFVVRLVPDGARKVEERSLATSADMLATATEARGLGGPFTAASNVGLNPRHVRRVLRAALDDVEREAAPLASR